MHKLRPIPNILLKTDVVFHSNSGMGGDGPSGDADISLKVRYDPTITRVVDKNGTEIHLTGMLFFNGKPLNFVYGQNVDVSSAGQVINAQIVYMDFPLNPDGTVHHSEIGLGG